MRLEKIPSALYPVFRAEDEQYVFIATFDPIMKDYIIRLQVVCKQTENSLYPTTQHYYKLGQIMQHCQKENPK